MYCWYKDSTNALASLAHCVTMYSLNSGDQFGWQSIHNDDMKDALHNGKYCKSGWARRVTLTTAECFEV